MFRVTPGLLAASLTLFIHPVPGWNVVPKVRIRPGARCCSAAELELLLVTKLKMTSVEKDMPAWWDRSVMFLAFFFTRPAWIQRSLSAVFLCLQFLITYTMLILVLKEWNEKCLASKSTSSLRPLLLRKQYQYVWVIHIFDACYT